MKNASRVLLVLMMLVSVARFSISGEDRFERWCRHLRQDLVKDQTLGLDPYKDVTFDISDRDKVEIDVRVKGFETFDKATLDALNAYLLKVALKFSDADGLTIQQRMNAYLYFNRKETSFGITTWHRKLAISLLDCFEVYYEKNPEKRAKLFDRALKKVRKIY